MGSAAAAACYIGGDCIKVGTGHSYRRFLISAHHHQPNSAV